MYHKPWIIWSKPGVIITVYSLCKKNYSSQHLHIYHHRFLSSISFYTFFYLSSCFHWLGCLSCFDLDPEAVNHWTFCRASWTGDRSISRPLPKQTNEIQYKKSEVYPCIIRILRRPQERMSVNFYRTTRYNNSRSADDSSPYTAAQILRDLLSIWILLLAH